MKIKFLKDYTLDGVDFKAGQMGEVEDEVLVEGLKGKGIAEEVKPEPIQVEAHVDSKAISDAVADSLKSLMGAEKKEVAVVAPEIKSIGDLTKAFAQKTINITTNAEGAFYATERNKEVVADLLKSSALVSRIPTLALTQNENVWKYNVVSSMGTAPAVTGESGNIGLSTQTVAQVSATLAKITYMFKTSLEAERDLAQLIATVNQEVPPLYANTIEKAILVNATLSNFTGVIAHAQTTSVAKESGQTAATFTAQNARDMFAQLKDGQYGGKAWVVTPEAYAQILGFSTGSAGQALFVGPTGSMADAPRGTLLGIPIIVSYNSGVALGTVGDVVLGNWEAYKIVEKGMSVATSSERYFDTGELAYRYAWNVAGVPIGYKLSTGEADFVTVATRS